jgi:DNA-binding FadR family transcriptional regulator
MKLAEDYLARYRQATDADEQTAIVTEYSSLFDIMSETDRAAARVYMQRELKPSIDETVRELDILVEKAELILGKQTKVSYP